MTKFSTTNSPDHDSTSVRDDSSRSGVGRREFLTFLVAAPTLTMATQLGGEGEAAAAQPMPAQSVPSLPGLPDVLDLGDVLRAAALPTSHLLILEIGKDNRVRYQLPRAEVGQGINTALAMVVAEEMDIPLSQVDVVLDDARPELVANQITGGSNTIRALYQPTRNMAAAAKTRLMTAAASQWNTTVDKLGVRDGSVRGPNGVQATYVSLAEAAADPKLAVQQPALKPTDQQKIVGTPTNRMDARAMVTGQMQYTLDLDVPGAMPTMVRRAPSINGTVQRVNNENEVAKIPGVLGITTIPTGVAVVAETFGQALKGTEALDVEWNGGTIDGLSDSDIQDKLKSATLPSTQLPLGTKHYEAEFEHHAVSHAPLESNSAIADVRADHATIWAGMKTPQAAQGEIARLLSLPLDKVTCHVVQAGGSFGRRLFWDGPKEAALVSKQLGRPIKLMWSRIDDMRHGRVRPPMRHRVRAAIAGNSVTAYEQRVSAVETDSRFGLGDVISSGLANLGKPGVALPVNDAVSQSIYLYTQKVPYNFGAVTELLLEIPMQMNTGSWRSVYSTPGRVAEEITVDEIAGMIGKDPVQFRRESLKTDQQRAVLDKVASSGNWGRKLPQGFAQGFGYHDEHKAHTACLIEMDGRDPKAPRVTKAVFAVDIGKAINPKGLEAQLLGGITDAISTVLTAGLHVDNGLPLEGSYSQFHYARQANSPSQVEIHIIESSDEPGGAGELALPAAAGAVANAYARATGVKPRSFPINFPVDFEPFPR